MRNNKMTRAQIERRYARKLDRLFASASFPTPAFDAAYNKIIAERDLCLARLAAPRLVKRGEEVLR